MLVIYFICTFSSISFVQINAKGNLKSHVEGSAKNKDFADPLELSNGVINCLLILTLMF